MTRLIAGWKAFWFPTTTTLNLAGARIVAVAAELVWLLPPLDFQITLATRNTEFIRPQPLIRLIDAVLPRETVFSADGLTTLYWLTVAVGVVALFGFCTRTALFLFALGVWFFVSHLYSYADIHHRRALFAIFLMALPFSPAGERLSVDAWLRRRSGRRRAVAATSDMAMWPLRLTHVLLALTYFSTGITKLLCCGLTWLNGYTLQTHIFSDAIERDIPLGIWLAQHHQLAVWLAVGTILFELFYFTSVLLPRTARFWFIGAILFHLGLWFTSGHPFFEHMVLNFMLLLFLDPDWFSRTLSRRAAPVSGTAQAAPQRT